LELNFLAHPVRQYLLAFTNTGNVSKIEHNLKTSDIKISSLISELHEIGQLTV